jgi:hypothetical protein
MFEMGHGQFDTVLNVQAYRSSMIDVTARDLPGWDHWHNLLPPYKEVDVGSVIMELWPAFASHGPDWSGKLTLKATYNTRWPGYEFLIEEWMAGMLSAMEEALVRILAQPDEEFLIAYYDVVCAKSKYCNSAKSRRLLC